MEHPPADPRDSVTNSGRNRSSGGWQERALRAGELVSGPGTARRARRAAEETVAGGFHLLTGPAGRAADPERNEAPPAYRNAASTSSQPFSDFFRFSSQSESCSPTSPIEVPAFSNAPFTRSP
jgi:hypothetical protein